MFRQKYSCGWTIFHRFMLLAVMLSLASLLACSEGSRAESLTVVPPEKPGTAEASDSPAGATTQLPGEDAATPRLAVTTVSCEYGASLLETRSTFAGATMPPGTRFAFTWRVLNSGNCPWNPGTTMFFSEGTLAGIVSQVNVPATAPDGMADVTVGFVAPEAPGEYGSLWKMRMSTGEVLGGVFPLRITVAPGAVEPTPSATSALTPTSIPLPTSSATAPPAPTATPAPPTATPDLTPEEPAWLGEYFNNPWVQGAPLTTRNDPEINFDWGTGSPAPLMPSNNFSVRWTQRVSLMQGTYRFTARSDDGIRVWVDNRLIIDEWQAGQNTTFQADLSVSAGDHNLRVEYYEDIQLANVQFSYRWVSAFQNWRGEYYNNRDLSGTPALERDDLAVAFNWGRGSPAAGVNSDNFSVRWTNSQFFSSGTYRFHARVDDGVRVYVDNVLILSDWCTCNQRELFADVTLSAGTHALRVEYFEATLEAVIYFWWDNGGGNPVWR